MIYVKENEILENSFSNTIYAKIKQEKEKKNILRRSVAYNKKEITNISKINKSGYCSENGVKY